MYIAGTVARKLLLRNQYMAMGNRVLHRQINGRVRLTDAERTTRVEIGEKLGKTALVQVASIAKPGTILAWHRKFMAQKFDGSQQGQSPGLATIDGNRRGE